MCSMNNAGNGGELDFILQADAQRLRETFDTHVFGTERMTRAVLPAMLARGAGRIVNVVSTVAYVPMPGADGVLRGKSGCRRIHQCAARRARAHSRSSSCCFRHRTPKPKPGKPWQLDLPSSSRRNMQPSALIAVLQARPSTTGSRAATTCCCGSSASHPAGRTASCGPRPESDAQITCSAAERDHSEPGRRGDRQILGVTASGIRRAHAIHIVTRASRAAAPYAGHKHLSLLR